MLIPQLSLCVTVKTLDDDQRASKEFKQKNPFDRYPLLECQDGVLSDALAIAGYVTRGSALEAKDRVAML